MWRVSVISGGRGIPAGARIFFLQERGKKRMQNNDDISFLLLFSFANKEYDDNECASYAVRILSGRKE